MNMMPAGLMMLNCMIENITWFQRGRNFEHSKAIWKSKRKLFKFKNLFFFQLVSPRIEQSSAQKNANSNNNNNKNYSNVSIV